MDPLTLQFKNTTGQAQSLNITFNTNASHDHLKTFMQADLGKLSGMESSMAAPFPTPGVQI